MSRAQVGVNIRVHPYASAEYTAMLLTEDFHLHGILRKWNTGATCDNAAPKGATLNTFAGRISLSLGPLRAAVVPYQYVIIPLSS